MKQWSSPVFWIMMIISVTASMVVLSMTPNAMENQCALTTHDLKRLRSNTPLQQAVSRIEEAHHQGVRSSHLFDSHTSAIPVMDEFESQQEAGLRTQIATLRVENDRLIRAIDQQAPNGASAFALLQLRERLTQVWLALPDDEPALHEEVLTMMVFIATELEELGVSSRIEEQEVRLRHRPDRRIPLDDILQQQEPQ